MHPILGYLSSAAIASAIYIRCLASKVFLFGGSHRSATGLEIDLGSGTSVYVFGFASALILMIAPWFLAVRVYRRIGPNSLVYFSALGGVGCLVLGCMTSLLVPRPLFVEDQLSFRPR